MLLPTRTMSRVRRAGIVLVALVLHSTPSASAQDADRIAAAGAVPWVTIGLFRAPTDQPLPLAPGHSVLGVSVGTAGSQVLRRRRHAIHGALIGIGAGLAAGFVIKSTDGGATCAGPGCEPYHQVTALSAFVYVPLVAGGVGALVGALVQTSEWVPSVEPSEATHGQIQLTWTLLTR